MDKRVFIKPSIAALAALLFIFSGCQDKDYYDPNAKINDNKEVSTIDFSTSRAVELKINYDITDGYVSTFDLYSENPIQDGVLRTDLEPISGGINIAGVSALKRTLPQYVSELYLYSTDIFIPKLMHAEIDNNIASFEPVAYTTVEESEVETRTINNSEVDGYLTKKSDYYPKKSGDNKKYDLINPIKSVHFPAEILNAISQTFPDDDYYKKHNKTAPDANYFQDAVIRILSDNEGQGVNIYVSLALADGAFRNSLSYFVYTDPKKDITQLTPDERKKLKLINIFQLADVHNNPYKQNSNSNHKGEGLSAGKAVKLLYVDNNGAYHDTFPVGAKIGFALHSDGFKESSFTANNDKILYSIAAWNTNSVKRTIFFGAKDKHGDSYNFFGFEDMIDETDVKIHDCNDVIFNVLTDPVDAIEPPKFIPESGTIEKTVSHNGILAFEDNWPRKGDYDLNDVVVQYNSTITYIQDGETTEDSHGTLVGIGDVTVKHVKDEFSFIHYGAGFSNGFSYKVNVNPGYVNNVKITDKDGSVNYSPVSDGTGFIIDLCKNVRDVIPPMQVVTTPAKYTVEMDFAEKAVKDKDFEKIKAPYNPFIKPVNTSILSDHIEVHLPFYPPTEQMDTSLFGTHDDVSKPEEGIYYAAEKGNYFPFALHLSEASEFKIPEERMSIEHSYSRYTNWVKNGCGDVDADWYLHPNK